MYTTTTKYSTNPPCRSHAFGASPSSSLLLMLLLLNSLETLSTSNTPPTALLSSVVVVVVVAVAPAATATHAKTPANSSSAILLHCRRSFTIRHTHARSCLNQSLHSLLPQSRFPLFHMNSNCQGSSFSTSLLRAFDVFLPLHLCFFSSFHSFSPHLSTPILLFFPILFISPSQCVWLVVCVSRQHID